MGFLTDFFFLIYTDTTCELWEINNLVWFLVVCIPNKEVSDSSKGMREMHVEFRTWSVKKFCPPLFLSLQEKEASKK